MSSFAGYAVARITEAGCEYVINELDNQFYVFVTAGDRSERVLAEVSWADAMRWITAEVERGLESHDD